MQILSTGGMAIDCTDEICEENIEYCINAAKTIRIRYMWNRYLYKRYKYSYKESNGIIMEINAAPGIRMHHYPFKR